MEIKQKKKDGIEQQWTQKEIEKYEQIIKKSSLPLFQFFTDLSNQNIKHHEPFYAFFIEDTTNQNLNQDVEDNNINENNNKNQNIKNSSINSKYSNYELKTRSIYKQPLRIQLLVNAIIKGSIGEKRVDKKYVFSKLFNAIKANHIMQFVGEGFFDNYNISVYKCCVSEKILDHLLNKYVYVYKGENHGNILQQQPNSIQQQQDNNNSLLKEDTALIFKNESLNVNHQNFRDFFLPVGYLEDNFKYYSLSDYLKKSTGALYKKAKFFIKHHDNQDPRGLVNLAENCKNKKQIKQQFAEETVLEPFNWDILDFYENIFTDLNEGITPELSEKLEYDRRCAENLNYKQEMCHYFSTNSCVHKMNSVKCKFAHSIVELRNLTMIQQQQQQQQLYYQQKPSSQNIINNNNNSNNNNKNNTSNSNLCQQKQNIHSNANSQTTCSNSVISSSVNNDEIHSNKSVENKKNSSDEEQYQQQQLLQQSEGKNIKKQVVEVEIENIEKQQIQNSNNKNAQNDDSNNNNDNDDNNNNEDDDDYNSENFFESSSEDEQDNDDDSEQENQRQILKNKNNKDFNSTSSCSPIKGNVEKKNRGKNNNNNSNDNEENNTGKAYNLSMFCQA